MNKVMIWVCLESVCVYLHSHHCKREQLEHKKHRRTTTQHHLTCKWNKHKSISSIRDDFLLLVADVSAIKQLAWYCVNTIAGKQTLGTCQKRLNFPKNILKSPTLTYLTEKGRPANCFDPSTLTRWSEKRSSVVFTWETPKFIQVIAWVEWGNQWLRVWYSMVKSHKMIKVSFTNILVIFYDTWSLCAGCFTSCYSPVAFFYSSITFISYRCIYHEPSENLPVMTDKPTWLMNLIRHYFAKRKV